MLTLSALAVSLLPLVSAHGYLKTISVNGGSSYLAWQVGQDDYVTPEPTRYARRIKDNGPVPDFTTADITCNVGGNIPAKGMIPVNPGDKVYVSVELATSCSDDTIASCSGINGVPRTLAP